MKYDKTVLVIILLGLSGVLLSILVPGGPVENRDFSHINPAVLLTFNIFLTVLGLGSFALLKLLWNQSHWAWKASMLAGISYILVYCADLAVIFPKSPTPMSPILLWIEIIGVVVAVPVVWFSYRFLVEYAQTVTDTGIAARSGKGIKHKTVLLIILSVVIVLFSTWSAMYSGK